MMKAGHYHRGAYPLPGCAGGAVMADDIRKVRSIEFRGLGLLSKYEVIRGARLKAVSDGIIVDVESVERVLSQNAFLASYGVEESGGRLVITVAEKKPVLIIAVGRGGRTALYELDADGAVISKDDVHTGRVPVLVLAEDDFSDGAATARTRSLMALLARVRRTNAALYRELSEISAAEGGIRVRIAGKKNRNIY